MVDKKTKQKKEKCLFLSLLDLSEDSSSWYSSSSLENNVGSSESSIECRLEDVSETPMRNRRSDSIDSDCDLELKDLPANNNDFETSSEIIVENKNSQLSLECPASAASLYNTKEPGIASDEEEDNYEIEEIFVSEDSSRAFKLSKESITASLNPIKSICKSSNLNIDKNYSKGMYG